MPNPYMPKNSHSRMLTESRRRKILASIKQNGQITTLEVVKRFSVSAVTARLDLEALSAGGAVIRRYGGALRHEPTRELRLKATLHRAEKVRIGRASARLIHSNEIIILDSGNTTTEIARQLKNAKLNSVTVITNA